MIYFPRVFQIIMLLTSLRDEGMQYEVIDRFTVGFDVIPAE
jgi:hypothetical protein